MNRTNAIRWTVGITVFVVALILVGLFVLSRLMDLMQRPLEGAERIAAAFRSGNLTETFLSSIPTVADAGRGRLEVATLEATETVIREDEQRLVWDLVPLGTTVSEIRVPVVYRYHLNLAEEWNVEVEGTVCRVTAPPLRPTLPVAMRTHAMIKRVDQGWARFDGAEQMALLEQSLSAHLTATARHPSRVDLARDAARRTVAAFAQDWLLSQQAWGNNGIDTIIVRFADEDPATIPPTVTIGGGEIELPRTIP